MPWRGPALKCLRTHVALAVFLEDLARQALDSLRLSLLLRGLGQADLRLGRKRGSLGDLALPKSEVRG